MTRLRFDARALLPTSSSSTTSGPSLDKGPITDKGRVEEKRPSDETSKNDAPDRPERASEKSPTSPSDLSLVQRPKPRAQSTGYLVDLETFCYLEHELDALVFREVDAITVEFEEGQRDDESCALVSVDERLILGDALQQGCSLLREIGVSVLSSVLRSRHRRLKETCIAQLADHLINRQALDLGKESKGLLPLEVDVGGMLASVVQRLPAQRHPWTSDPRPGGSPR